MRIRFYGAQLTPGIGLTPYVSTSNPQIMRQQGIKTLVWGDSPQLELADPGWTVRGAKIEAGDKFTAWDDSGRDDTEPTTRAAPPLPHYASIVFSVPYQDSPEPLDIISLGESALVLINGKLGWRSGNDAVDLEMTIPPDTPVYVLYEAHTDSVRLWFNNGVPIAVPIVVPQPTQFVIGGGAGMEVTLTSLHTGSIPSGGPMAMYRYARRIISEIGLTLPEAIRDLDGVQINGYDVGSIYAALSGDIRDWAKTWQVDGVDYTIHFLEVAP